MALVGNTVRIIIAFKDFNGIVVPASNIVMTISDFIGSTPIELNVTNDDIQLDGTYIINYTIPDGFGPLKIKVSGDVDGLPEVNYITVRRENGDCVQS